MPADEGVKEALFWEASDHGSAVDCRLCPWNCHINPDDTGICQVRENRDGTLYSISYGELTSVAMDPIEKKPLYHFRPGTQIMSVGSFGCNLKCSYCQNWRISQQRPSAQHMSPQQLAETSRQRASQGNIGVAYTYNEPIIFYEFVYDTARLVAENGQSNVMVTNGLIQPEPLDQLLAYIDAMNVDVKSMDNDFYKSLCGGRVEPVLRTVENAIDRCHIEITNLLIPGENDSEQEIQDLVDWAAGVSPDMPIHFSAYRPAYKEKIPATGRDSLRRAWDIATEKLHHVFVGNMFIDGTTDTRCPECGETVISRSGFGATITGLQDGRCESCGGDINVVQE
jgi:pyruvate formate lyase activating enzyme